MLTTTVAKIDVAIAIHTTRPTPGVDARCRGSPGTKMSGSLARGG